MSDSLALFNDQRPLCCSVPMLCNSRIQTRPSPWSQECSWPEQLTHVTGSQNSQSLAVSTLTYARTMVLLQNMFIPFLFLQHSFLPWVGSNCEKKINKNPEPSLALRMPVDLSWCCVGFKDKQVYSGLSHSEKSLEMLRDELSCWGGSLCAQWSTSDAFCQVSRTSELVLT